MATLEEFGKRIKEKYSQYGDLSDREVGEKVLQRYPQYRNLVTETVMEETPQVKRDILERTAGILDAVFGGGAIGEAIGAAAAKLGLTGLTPEQRQSISGPSDKKVIGDIAQAGLTVGTLGGLGAAGGLAARAAKTAGLGAAFTGAAALKQEEEIMPGKLALGAGIGAAIPIVGAGLKLTGKAIFDVLPKRLMQSAIGQTKAEILAGKDVSEFALKKWRIGTMDNLIGTAQKTISDLSQKIQANLAKVPMARILKNEVVSDVVERVNSAGGAIDAEEVNTIINTLAPQTKGILQRQSFSLPEANRLRQLLDQTLGDRGFLISQLPFNKSILRTFDNALREKVKILAPEGTKAFFSELSKEITLRDALLERSAVLGRTQAINAFDLIFAAMGAGGGAFAGELPGALLAGGGAFALKKGIQSAIGKTFSAKTLDVVGKIRPLLAPLTPTERAIILRLFGEESASVLGEGTTSGQSKQ